MLSAIERGLTSFSRIILITIVATGLLAFDARPLAPQGAPARTFHIGYLTEGSDLENAHQLMEQLRQFLRKRDRVWNLLRENGFEDIILSPCGTPGDMIQRMNEKEFDLLFATALVYARRRTGEYDQPILQTWRPGDLPPSGARGGVLQRGIVFAGPTSPLFDAASITSETIRRELERQPLAVPSAESSPGYIYPRLKLWQDYNLQRPAGFLFCGSDEEVVKHVVSGLVQLGACREGALDTLAGQDKGAPKYYQELFKTAYMPTDPILIRNQYFPSRSALGTEIKSALRDFFTPANRVTSLKVETASAREYEMLSSALRALDNPDLRQVPPTATTTAPTSPTAPVQTTTTATTGLIVPPPADDQPTSPLELQPALPEDISRGHEPAAKARSGA